MYKRFALVLVLVFLTASCIIMRLTSADPVPMNPPIPINPPISNAYIRSDGSIDPSTLPIHRNGNVYTFMSNVSNYALEIQCDNIVVDGANFTLQGNGAYGCQGITLPGRNNVTIENLGITQFGLGIELSDGSGNTISGNNMVNNMIGINLFEASNNLIVENNVTSCSIAAFKLYDSSNNSVYHNIFINNTNQVEDGSSGQISRIISLNIWDDGYPSGGNYWSDYLARYPKAAEIDSSRIGDIPYVVDVNNTDQYPLMEPFNNTFYMLETTPPKISVLSPVNQAYNESSVSLVFAVDKPVNWTGYSLDGKQNVTITGNTTIGNVANGLHNITIYANDTFGIVGASETITFTIALATFPTAPVAAVSGASAAVVVVAGLLVYFKKRKR